MDNSRHRTPGVPRRHPACSGWPVPIQGSQKGLLAALIAHIPLGRVAGADEVASVALFLASLRWSFFVNGGTV